MGDFSIGRRLGVELALNGAQPGVNDTYPIITVAGAHQNRIGRPRQPFVFANVDLRPTIAAWGAGYTRWTLSGNAQAGANAAPVGNDNVVTILENTSHTFGVGDFRFTDPNDYQSPDSLLAVKIVSLPVVGTLTKNGSAVSAGAFISVTDINNNLLVYTPAANATGTPYADFTFQVQDAAGTANGSLDTDVTARQMKINVMSSGWVNYAPVGTSSTITLLEDAPYQLSASDFGFTDPNGAAANNFLAVQINSLPSNGRLTDNGVPVNAMDFVSISHINDGLLVFEPELDANGASYDSLTFKVKDDGGTANAGANIDTTARTITIDVTAFNDRPTSSLPAPQTTNEDSALVFSTANSNAITIADVEAGSSSVQATLTVTHGALTLGTTTGLSFSFSDFDGTGAGDGTNDATMTFRGTISNINTALNGLTFAPTSNYNGSATLNIIINDLGNTGSGGAGTNDETLEVSVNAVNDAPVNTVPGSQSTSEDTALVFSTGNSNAISIADVDASTSSVQVKLTATHGTLTLSGTTGLTFTVGDGTTDVTMIFTGTLSNINAALNGLTYTPTANFAGSASARIETSDLGNTGSGGTLTDDDTVAITVTPDATNDAPVNIKPSGQTTNEDTNLIFSSTGGNPMAVSDDSAAATIQVALTGTNGTLTLSSTTGLSFSFSDANGTGTGDGTSDATMRFRGTLANINAALNGLIFTPTANYNGSGAAVQIVTNDLGNTGTGGVLTDTDTVAITVDAVNDAPVNSVPGTQSVNEDTAKVFSFIWSNVISIADTDAGSSSMQVTLTGTNGVITLGGTTGLTFSTGDGTSDAAMVFTGTISSINTALSGLSFLPSANFNGTASLQIITSDQGNTGSGGTLTDTDTISITVNAVNDNPVNSVPGAQTTTKNVNLVFSTGNGNLISIGDVDIGSAIMQISLTAFGGTLSLSGTSGLSFSFNDSNGTGAGDGTSDGTMTFRGTLADLNAALAGLTFIPTTNYTGSASISITTKDLFTGTSGFDMDSIMITINP